MYYEEGQVNFSQTLRDWRLRAALLHKRRGLVYNILALACVFLVVLFILDARVGDERAPAAWPWRQEEAAVPDYAALDVRSELEAAVGFGAEDGRRGVAGGQQQRRHAGAHAIDTFLEQLRLLEVQYRLVGDADMVAQVAALRDEMRACKTLDPRLMLDCTQSGSASDDASGGQGNTCRLPEDEWLQLRRLRGDGIPAGSRKQKRKRYFVAFNLHNNAALMPHFLTELTKFLSFFDLEGGQVYVSAFESGSSDMTPAWMDLFDQVLDAYKMPHRVLFGDYDLRLQVM